MAQQKNVKPRPPAWWTNSTMFQAWYRIRVLTFCHSLFGKNCAVPLVQPKLRCQAYALILHTVCQGVENLDFLT